MYIVQFVVKFDISAAQWNRGHHKYVHTIKEIWNCGHNKYVHTSEEIWNCGHNKYDSIYVYLYGMWILNEKYSAVKCIYPPEGNKPTFD